MRPGEIVRLKYPFYGKDGKQIIGAGEDVKLLYFVTPTHIRVQVIDFSEKQTYATISEEDIESLMVKN